MLVQKSMIQLKSKQKSKQQQQQLFKYNSFLPVYISFAFYIGP